MLASLVDKSLVLAEPRRRRVRYRLLESTRAYALEKLVARGERERSRVATCTIFENASRELWAQREEPPGCAERAEALRTEFEDVRSALDGALTRSDDHRRRELLADIGGVATPRTRRRGYCALRSVSRRAPAERIAAPRSFLGCLSFFRAQAGQKMRAFELATESVAARASERRRRRLLRRFEYVRQHGRRAQQLRGGGVGA